MKTNVYISYSDESILEAQKVQKQLEEKGYFVFPLTFPMKFNDMTLNSNSIKAIASRDKHLPHVAQIRLEIIRNKVEQIEKSQFIVVINDKTHKLDDFNFLDISFAWFNSIDIFLWEDLDQSYPYYNILKLFSKQSLKKDINNLPYKKILVRKGIPREEKNEMQEK